MATFNGLDFIINKKELHTTRIVGKEYTNNLSKNQVLLEVDRFAFTSNNITYGIVGEQMNYWKFFPSVPGFGIIPVWGMAKVVASNHPDVRVGQRFYGYYPMSTHLLVLADRVSKMGFLDITDHRLDLPRIYNYYTNVESDPSITAENEDLISLFRPLFLTSFLIDDYLARQQFFKASQIMIISASSKTAQALVHLLTLRRNEEILDLRFIGLTSENNKGFVSGSGLYDEVLSYGEINYLNTNEKVALVDFRGNHETQYELQVRLKDHLVHNCLVGIVDWKNLRGDKVLPRKGSFFFAPEHAAKRQEEWGRELFQEKMGAAWQRFEAAITSIISVEEYTGLQALKPLYLDMLDGNIDPAQGNILNLRDTVS